MASSDFLQAWLPIPFFLPYPVVFHNKCFFNWWFACRISPQDLPCSLSKPVSGSCCLYNGVHIAGKQIAATLVPTSLPKGGFATRLIISLLHQQFTCVHLPDTQLPFLQKAFLCPFTTTPLRLQQRRVFWQPRLYSVAGEPKLLSLSLLHLWKNFHGTQ